jgi:hypothetical protein
MKCYKCGQDGLNASMLLFHENCVQSLPDDVREWMLPLNTLIINSDFYRPGGVHVIEKSTYDKLKSDMDRLNTENQVLTSVFNIAKLINSERPDARMASALAIWDKLKSKDTKKRG